MPKAPDGHGGEVDVELSEYSNHFFIAYHFDSFWFILIMYLMYRRYCRLSSYISVPGCGKWVNEHLYLHRWWRERERQKQRERENTYTHICIMDMFACITESGLRTEISYACNIVGYYGDLWGLMGIYHKFLCRRHSWPWRSSSWRWDVVWHVRCCRKFPRFLGCRGFTLMAIPQSDILRSLRYSL